MLGQPGTTCKWINMDNTYLTQYTKGNSKWVKDWKERVETIKLSEENIGKNLFDPELGNGLLNMKTKA